MEQLLFEKVAIFNEPFSRNNTMKRDVISVYLWGLSEACPAKMLSVTFFSNSS